MSKKIGRNEPCPCGSGKKYKRCCLNVERKGIAGDQEISMDKIPLISRLALMRFEEDLKDNQELVEKLSDRLLKLYPERDFKDFLLKTWDSKKVRAMSTSDIIEKFNSMGVKFEEELFKEQTRNYISAIQLAEGHYYTQDFKAEGLDEDFIWLAIIELWKRLAPGRFNIEMIDESIQDGYKYLRNWNYENCIEQWENAWIMINTIVPSDIKSVWEADEFIPVPLTQFISNWCHDFEMELGNAGRGDKSYIMKRIRYCNEFCGVFPDSDDLTIQNMLRAEAESYAALGDSKTAEQLFETLIQKFPESIWGYVGWGDMYCLHRPNDKIPLNHNKAEEIYRLGLARCNTDKDVIYDRLEGLEKRRNNLSD